MKTLKSVSFRHISSHISAAVFAVALFTLTANPVSAAISVTEKFTAAGTFNWTCPAFVTSVQVECWGGGGAGGGSFVNGGTANAGGGGGGGGAYAALISVPVTAGNIYSFTIPAAATCPTSGFTNGQKFDGSPVTFTGDIVSVTANGGVGGGSAVVTAATAISGAAGAGGAAGTGFSAAWKGGNAVAWSGGNGGGGGGGAGDLAAGGNSAAVNGSFGVGGTGSDADHTGGAGGASRSGAGPGSSASSPGGGGGGAKNTAASATSRAGGAGGLGRVILTYTPVFPIVVKDDNALGLSGSSSWVGGLAPDTNKLAKWNSTVTSANTTDLGANLTWLGIAIENPNGLVTINPGSPAGNTLTLAAGGIDLSTVDTADLTLACPLSLAASNIWIVATGRTLTVGGAVSGAFPVTKQGAGKVIFSSANTYTGDTTISGGTVQLAATNLIPDGAGKGNITLNGTLDLNGQSETLNGLSGTGTIDNPVATTTSTLTVGGNDQSGSFTGVLKNTGASATLNLIKTGTGTQVLGGANTLSGAVTINGGTLAVSNIAPLGNVTGITMADGTTLRPDITNAVINAPITLGAMGTTSSITAPNVAGSGTTSFPFNLGGAVSGAGNLTLVGVSSSNAYGAINLNAASNYTGTTLITCSDDLASPTTLGNQNIFVRLFVDNALPVTTVLTLNGGLGAPAASAPGRYCELNLNGKIQTLAGLQNVSAGNLRVQRVVNSNAQTSTLTINNVDPYIYAGQLGWVSGFGSTAYNNFNLTKSGLGTQTFSGPLQYTGNTTVTGGTLSLGTINPNNELASVTIGASGILKLTFSGSDTVDKLFINGIQQPAGTYGHSSTGATNGGGGSLDTYFASGDGTLNVTSSTSSFSSWITGTFAGGAAVPSGQQGPNQDPDNDGTSNLVEFAIAGQDPTVPNASVGSFTSNTLSYTKRASTSGLTYAIQDSTDLGVTDTWAEVLASPPIYTNSSTLISYTLTPGTPARNFVRLQVLSN